MRWPASPAPIRYPPGFIPPCLPTLPRQAPDGPLWAHGIKHFIVRRERDRVRAFSRRGWMMEDLERRHAEEQRERVRKAQEEAYDREMCVKAGMRGPDIDQCVRDSGLQ
jgi:hypothetical protein